MPPELSHVEETVRSLCCGLSVIDMWVFEEHGLVLKRTAGVFGWWLGHVGERMDGKEFSIHKHGLESKIGWLSMNNKDYCELVFFMIGNLREVKSVKNLLELSSPPR